MMLHIFAKTFALALACAAMAIGFGLLAGLVYGWLERV